ncbi:hypothetical protein OG357_17080 [Streptomyces sp. NBC_01255]|uniref:hypothetical protein n=1 Tax=Streptomyces sp. NBC_01255 TaxID=2903798 RepID=UPI002E367C3B|nr:hypothetical protein [Streptomyces sp. NBC_01255]
MSTYSVSPDDDLPAVAGTRHGVEAPEDVVRRAQALRWLQDNAERFIDFDVLEERARYGPNVTTPDPPPAP